MKKSLLALAVLGAFAGAASAQSSVTIYGIIDVGVAKTNSGQSNLTFFPTGIIGRQDVWTVRSSTSSRLGFRGTEDLGGGLKANFTIEHRLAPDSGDLESGAAGFWHAQSWVGLSSTTMGEVRIGRQYVPAFWVGLASDPWGYDYNYAGAAGWTRGGNGVTRANNAVTYRTPNLAGFSAEVQVAAGEGGSAVFNSAGYGRNVGANAQYNAGPLWVGLGYNQQRKMAGTTPDNSFWNLGAAYDFGFVRPIVQYSAGKNSITGNPTVKTYFVGATAPLGGGTLKAVVARYNAAAGTSTVPGAPGSFNVNASNTTLPGNWTGEDTTKFGLGYEYFLSKRTSVHADVGTAKTTTFSRSTGVEAGIKHTF
jgi:predicted porin